MTYLLFILRHWRLLGFGFLLTMFSSFGQTYYVSLFSAEFREAFGLGHGGFGLVYSVATLASAACLVWLGRLIDQMDLRWYAGLTCAGLVAACFVTSAVTSAIWLTLAIFLLRLTCQGLMSHTAVTTMARYFEAERGRAVSIAQLGYAVGRAVLPVGAVLIVAAVGWRQTWTLTGVVLAVVLVPAVLWLLKGQAERHRAHVARLQRVSTDAGAAVRQWSRADVLRDPRFYLLMPVTLASAFITTGLVFHQVHLVAAKGWDLTWFVGSFVLFSIATTVAALIAGPVIDRHGAARLLPYFLLPMAASLVLLAYADHAVVVPVYMVATGVSSGASMTIAGTLWAEIYGVRHLGAIRAVTSALTVFASALSPVAMGWLLDAGVSIEAIALMCVGYIAAATALLATPALRAARMVRREPA